MKATVKVLSLCLAFGAMHFTAPAQSLLLHYNFDEANSGSEPAEDLGQLPAAPGFFTAPATRTATTPGGFSLGALDLTDSTAYVTGGDADKLDGLLQLTLTAWINLQGAPAHGNRIMAKQVTTGNFDGFSFAFNNPTAGTIGAENFQLNLALGGSGFAFNTSGADMGAADRWVFVAVTYDGTQSSNNVTFYTGNELDSVTQFGVTGSANVGALIPNSNEFRVGASSGGTTSPPDYMDDVRVYDSVLSAAQLEAVRAANIPEPSTFATLGAGLALLAVIRRRRRTA